MITKILIGVDDSIYAENAARYGFELARKFNAEVGLAHIVEPVIMPESTMGLDPAMGSSMQGTGIEDLEILDIQKNQAENIVERTIKKFAAGMQVAHFTEYGPTAGGIISCGREFGADLIIIGTHSRSGLDHILTGSIAEDVVRYSEVPVLVVPFEES